jgi:hypothetical protein
MAKVRIDQVVAGNTVKHNHGIDDLLSDIGATYDATYLKLNASNDPLTGTLTISPSGTPYSLILKTDNGGGDDFSRIQLAGHVTGIAGVFNRAAGHGDTDIYFGESADTGKYIFRGGALTSEGNVGINVASPTNSLEISTTTATKQSLKLISSDGSTVNKVFSVNNLSTARFPYSSQVYTVDALGQVINGGIMYANGLSGWTGLLSSVLLEDGVTVPTGSNWLGATYQTSINASGNPASAGGMRASTVINNGAGLTVDQVNTFSSSHRILGGTIPEYYGMRIASSIEGGYQVFTNALDVAITKSGGSTFMGNAIHNNNVASLGFNAYLSDGGSVELNAGAAGTTPLYLDAAASQTAHLTVWRNSSDSPLTYVEADGEIVIAQDSKAMKFGAGVDASIMYDGANLVVNPKVVGSGFVSVLGKIEALVSGAGVGLKVYGTSTGYVQLVAGNTVGDGGHTGYLGFYKPDDTRLGYLGFHASDVQMNLENSARFVVDGGSAKMNSHIEIDGDLDHDGTNIGFFGITPTTRQTELTDELTTITHTAPGTPDYAIAAPVDSSGGAAFGFSTADEFNTVMSVVTNLQTRTNELETKLTAYGLLQDAD